MQFGNFFLALIAVLAGFQKVDATRSRMQPMCTLEEMSPVPAGWSKRDWDHDDLEDVSEVITQHPEIKLGNAVYKIGSGTYGKIFGVQYMCPPEGGSGSAALGDWVALKIVKPKRVKIANSIRKTLVTTAPREVAVMRALNAVSTYGVTLVAAVHDKDKDPDKSNWVEIMEACEKGDMQLALEKSSMTSAALAAVYLDAMAGVSDMHKHNLVHRDIKPGNILITKEGRGKLTDFGSSCSRAAGMEVANCGGAPGTPFFLPPEYADVKDYQMDEKADMWAMGIIFYQILHGPETPAVIFDASHLVLYETIAAFDIKSDAEFKKLSAGSDAALLLEGLLEKDPRKRLTANDALPLVQRWAGLGARSPPAAWRACPA